MTTTPSSTFAGVPARPGFDLTEQAGTFAPLGGAAFPVTQDRWERLVTMATIPEPAERVWAALVETAQIKEWFGVVHGDWAVRGRESTLDFEDGEFFYCRTDRAIPPTQGRAGTLRYLWRWVGIGPAAAVTWTLTPGPSGTVVTAVEEATNPPADWRSWNGMGWPGILDQLAAYLRTGTNTRWPWRRMGPYLQIPLPAMPFQAWEALTGPGAVKHWMQRTSGSLAVDDEMSLTMGDASGTMLLTVTKSVEAGQEFPSYLPYVEFTLRRPSWRESLGGRMWIEPGGLGESLLQIFHYDWERLDIPDPVTERKLLTDFWVNAAGRARQLLQPQAPPAGPHGWSMSGNGQAAANGHKSDSAANGHRPADPAATMEFVNQVVGDLGGAMTTLMTALGVRLGLFGALAGGPATPAELADRTGLAERYVTEWLWCLTSAGYVRYDRDATAGRNGGTGRGGGGRFALPAEHAAVLAAEGSPFDLTAGHELVPPLAGMLDELTDAFRTGRGVSPDRYPDELYAAMERMSAVWLDHMLVDQWLPAVDGLVARLERGGRVAEIGSGRGRALINMARRFGAAEFDGYDLHAPNVERAAKAAEAAGVADRVRFHTADAVTQLDGPLDLVTMFDTLHDAPDPQATLAAAHRALAPTGGVLLVLESAAADDAEDNAGPQGAILYATSALYCVPTALGEGGPALGTLGLPHRELAAMARRSGFGRVEEVPIQSPWNALYVLRP